MKDDFRAENLHFCQYMGIFVLSFFNITNSALIFPFCDSVHEFCIAVIAGVYLLFIFSQYNLFLYYVGTRSALGV